MTRMLRIALGALALQAAAPALAAPAFVQERDSRITSGSTIRLSFTKANAAGNLIAVYVVWRDPSAVSVRDSRGNLYASAVGPTSWGSGNTRRAQIFYARNVAAGSNAVTATFSQPVTAAAAMFIHEYSGLNATAPLDAVAAATGTAAAMSSGSATTGSAGTCSSPPAPPPAR